MEKLSSATKLSIVISTAPKAKKKTYGSIWPDATGKDILNTTELLSNRSDSDVNSPKWGLCQGNAVGADFGCQGAVSVLQVVRSKRDSFDSGIYFQTEDVEPDHFVKEVFSGEGG